MPDQSVNAMLRECKKAALLDGPFTSHVSNQLQLLPNAARKISRSGVPTTPSPLRSAGQALPSSNVQLPSSTFAAALKFSASAYVHPATATSVQAVADVAFGLKSAYSLFVQPAQPSVETKQTAATSSAPSTTKVRTMPSLTPAALRNW